MTFLERAGLVAFLVLSAAGLGGDPGRAEDVRPIRKIVVSLPFEDAEVILRAEAERQNLNLVNILDIKKGMENRGGTFRPYKIYQFCNLDLGIRIYSDAPDYGAFQFCSVLIYEVQRGRTALVSARQTWMLSNLPEHRASAGAVAAAREFEKKIDEIFDAMVEEGRAKGK